MTRGGDISYKASCFKFWYVSLRYTHAQYTIYMDNCSAIDLLLFVEKVVLGFFHYFELRLFRNLHKPYIELFDCHVLQLFLFSVPGAMKSLKLLAFEILCLPETLPTPKKEKQTRNKGKKTTNKQTKRS